MIARGVGLSENASPIRCLDPSPAYRQRKRGMENETDEPAFLRDLVKASRQKIHQVKWVDRDGTDRVTRLSVPEQTRLNAIAHDRKISMSEVMRQAAHVPVSPRSAAGPSA